MWRYWWSRNVTKRGWPMVAYKTMCKPKREGGLGFRDLHSFNMALLGKQLWCFKEQGSLVARVLRAKYFPSGGFLNASLMDKNSFAWKGLHRTLQVLNEGLFWRIGAGSLTPIHCDKWGCTKLQRRVYDNERMSKVWSIIAKIQLLPVTPTDRCS
ncbi:uncharacterized mitochondrial protein AtMg00310-like [Hibiscus syriacus]|uniref:uncharacterized mitochondrial protein AtMg00310-like n=1 Tax=Hibiscus syriacus TaxID=106335 RepID=UPI0019249B79|nr:uncharacterized mitochondrial protein AtMg00310-like [Hibiscus syriacus]